MISAILLLSRLTKWESKMFAKGSKEDLVCSCFFNASSSKFFIFWLGKHAHCILQVNSSGPVSKTHTEKKVLGSSFLHTASHKKTGGGQSEHVYDSVGWNTTKGITHTHFLEVRKGNLLFVVIWALFVFYGPWVTLGLCVYSHALFGLRRTTCARKLWHG